VGKRSLALPENVRPDRLQLVGLMLMQGERLNVGSHVHLRGSQQTTDGWITSSGRLASDAAHVALAMVRAGRSHMDEVVTVHDSPHGDSLAKVVAPVFYDPTGERLNG
jgi:sarcosine oxidase subunit alpha